MYQNTGFTLIELLVVVLIIGILSAVALPQYTLAVEKSRVAEALVMLKAIAQANEVYYLANGAYTTKLEDLDITVPGEDSTHGGYARKNSKHFQYGARDTADDLTVAIANRLPVSSSYWLTIRGGETRVRCKPIERKGSGKFKALSNSKREGG